MTCRSLQAMTVLGCAIALATGSAGCVDPSPHAPVVLRDGLGTRLAVWGARPASPAPTVFVFALDCESTLREPKYPQVGAILASRGFLCVSLDMPCHGEDVEPGEPKQLDGWRFRADAGKDFVGDFVSRASAVLDYLIDKRYTDAKRVAVCGTSRGGFLALHFAAADGRVGCAVAFSPVTDLLVLREFSDSDEHGTAASLALRRSASQLAGKPVWICIGNNDRRVGTESAMSFAGSLARASVDSGRPVAFEIHVMPSDGHHTPPGTHEMAAKWIQECILANKSEQYRCRKGRRRGLRRTGSPSPCPPRPWPRPDKSVQGVRVHWFAEPFAYA